MDKVYTQLDKDSYIIRYISLGKLIELLDSKALHLGRIDLFEDKTEGEWYAHLARTTQSVVSYLNIKEAEMDDESLLNHIQSLKKRSYISAWFSSDYLSIAMWKLYGLTDEGIAIRVHKERFHDLIELNRDMLNDLKADVLFSNVIYVDEDEHEVKKVVEKNLNNHDWMKFRNLLLKHKAYKFEEEYRMSVMLPENSEEYPLGLKLNLGENLNDFIDSIYLNPLIHSQHWYIKVVKKVMDLFGIEPIKLKLGEIKTDLS